MAKQKLSLTELKVESCVTSLTGDQLGNIKGGARTVIGRTRNYVIRWTAVDTRVQSDFSPVNGHPTGGNG